MYWLWLCKRTVGICVCRVCAYVPSVETCAREPLCVKGLPRSGRQSRKLSCQFLLWASLSCLRENDKPELMLAGSGCAEDGGGVLRKRMPVPAMWPMGHEGEIPEVHVLGSWWGREAARALHCIEWDPWSPMQRRLKSKRDDSQGILFCVHMLK